MICFCRLLYKRQFTSKTTCKKCVCRKLYTRHVVGTDPPHFRSYTQSLGLRRSELVVLDSWDSLVNSPVSWWTRVTNSLVISCKFTEEQSKTRFPFLFYRPKSQEEKPRGRALGCGVLHTASYDQIPDSNVPARE